MDYHLYFHDDFDGPASAAIFVDFFKKRGGRIISFNPIDYAQISKEAWPKFKFKEPFVMVDFLYHPKAGWWVDHHVTTFTEAIWRKRFKNDNQHWFNGDFKSCCSLVLDFLKKKHGYKPPKYIEKLAKWGDIIDSASYKSAKQAIEAREGAIILALLLDDNSGDLSPRALMLKEKIIKSLAEKDIDLIVKESLVKKLIADLRRKRAKRMPKRKDITLFKNVLFSDNTNLDTLYSHYFGYYLYPKIRYSVYIKKLDSNNYPYHVGCGRNPWLKDGTGLNLGRLMKKFNGGGHHDVGGTETKTKSEALEIADKLIKYLNEHG